MPDRKTYKVLDAVTATGEGKTIQVTDFDKITIVVVSAASGGDASLTYQIKGAIALPDEDTGVPVDFGAAASATNPWDYIDVIDMEDGTSIDGDTGVVLTTTNEVRQFTVNAEGLDYITVDVTAYTQGALTAWIAGYNYN